MNEKQYMEFLSRLASKQFPDWIPAMSIGKELYQRLLDDLLNPKRGFSKWQIINGMKVLFRLRHWGDIADACNVLLSYSVSDFQLVRDSACSYLLLLMRMQNQESRIKDRLRSDQKMAIKIAFSRARQKGLSQEILDMISSFEKNNNQE